MRAFITEHQFNQIFFGIQNEYECFGTQKIGKKIIFDKLTKKSKVLIPTPKTIIPFKKILWPDGQELKSPNHDQEKSPKIRKIALIGLTNCDASAVDIFLKQFAQTGLMISRENILIVSTQCHPDEHCFCTSWGLDKIKNFDLHIQKELSGYSIFANSDKAKKILRDNGVRYQIRLPKLNDIVLEDREKIDQKELPIAVNDKTGLIDFWQIVSNNCFGCGSCSAVCPLCFFTRQDFKNDLSGGCKKCLNADSCFSKSFSEIQNHVDFRPTNLDRLYNWYHHKFVRSFHTDKEFLCTGCGRCIENCPASLNQYRIILSLIKREEKIN